MRMEDFPRPKYDTRRGINWSAASQHPAGRDLDVWIGELEKMRIRWVKLLDDGAGSSLELCERLVAAGIVPIVQLERQPGTGERPVGYGRLAEREQDTMRRLIQAGVRYFESDDRPDLPIYWQGHRPDDWASRVVERFIADADEIIAMGGLPGLPALSDVTQANLPQLIVEAGRRDLLEAGVWVGVLSHTLNRPPDFPFDTIARAGTELSQEEYDRLGAWAWDGLPREEINQRRAAGRKADAQPGGAGASFLSFVVANDQAAQAAGHPLPIIATEGGPAVAAHDDLRYPRVDPQRHAQAVALIDAFMQGGQPLGGLQRPDNFLAVCYLLLADARMGATEPRWEASAWYTDRWNSAFGLQDQLPAVATLAAPRQPVPVSYEPGAEAALLPAAARAPAPLVVPSVPAEPPVALPASRASVLSGQMARADGSAAAGVPVTLASASETVAQASTQPDGSFRFEQLPLGVYRLAAPGLTVAGIALDGVSSRRVRLALGAEAAPATAPGRIDGNLPGGEPGRTLMLSGVSGQRTTTLADDDTFAFPNVAPGTYRLSLEGVGVIADPVDVAPGGLYKLIFPLRSRIQGRALPVGLVTVARLYARHPWNWTRQAALAADGSFAFEGLPAGRYDLHIGPQMLSGLELTGQNTRQLPPIDVLAAAEGGTLAGQVIDAAGHAKPDVPVILQRAGVFVARTRSTAAGQYSFANLPSGSYELALPQGLYAVALDVAASAPRMPAPPLPQQPTQVPGEAPGNAPGKAPQPPAAVAPTGAAPAAPASAAPAAIARREPAPLAHYLLFGSGRPAAAGEPPTEETRVALSVALDYLQHVGATGGFSLDEAGHAQQVTIVGDRVSAEDEARLVAAGCQVNRLSGDAYALAQAFQRLLQASGEG